MKRLFLLFLIMLLLCSCKSKYSNEKDVFLYNSNESYCFCNADKYVFVSDSVPFFIDKSNCKALPVEMNPLERYNDSEDNFITSVHSYGCTAYLLKSYNSDNNDLSVSLDRIDLNNFNKTTVLKLNTSKSNFSLPEWIKPNSDTYSGYFDEYAEFYDSSDWSNINTWFVYNDTLYFVSNHFLYSCSFKSKRPQKLCDFYVEESMACDGKDLYFLNSKKNILSYNFKSKKISKVSDCLASELYIDKSNIYYKSLSDNCTLHMIDKISNTDSLLINKKVFEFQKGRNNVLFYLDENYKLHSENIELKKDNILFDFDISTYYYDDINNDIYYQTGGTNESEQVNLYFKYSLDDATTNIIKLNQ